MKLEPMGSHMENFDGLIKTLKGMIEHRKKKPTVPSSLAFYESQLEYYQNIRYAHDDGKLLVLHSAFAPAEIFFAMDLVPAHASFSLGAMAQVLKKQPECLEASHKYGLPWEICGAHRLVVGAALLGLTPHVDLCVSYHFGCTSAGSSAVNVGKLYNLPIYYIQLPYGYKEYDIRSYVRQLESLIDWLTKQTGHKLDWDRLKETVKIEKQIYEYEREIEELRGRIPSPMKHRSYMEQYQTDMMMPGTQTALHYYKTLRDEVKDFAERRIHPLGPDHKEKYRVISCFMPPNWCRSLMDWMEEEHGISSVAEPHMNEWSAWLADRIDPDKPLESLAVKYQNHLVIRQLCSPLLVNQLPDTLKHVEKRKADGAIYYASVTCNTSPHLLTCLKDALGKKNVPLLILDNDVLDPAYASESEMRERVDAFVEVMNVYKEKRASIEGRRIE